jgi:peptide/nickel transport system substrate-binding protein
MWWLFHVEKAGKPGQSRKINLKIFSIRMNGKQGLGDAISIKGFFTLLFLYAIFPIHIVNLQSTSIIVPITLLEDEERNMNAARIGSCVNTVLAILLILSACLAPAAVSAQDDESFACPATGGTLITVLTDDPVSLNGIYANDGASISVLSFIFNPLTLGGENWGTQITGDLAKEWEVSEDGLTWTFYLHEGVTWHDGEELTAEDVVYSFQTIQDPENEIAPFRPRFLQGGEPIEFEATDDYTVVARLNEPNASFFTDISVPIVPKHVLDGQDLREGPFNREPIGTGPFKLAEWNTGESVVLEAHDDYFRGRPCIDRLIFRIIPDEQSQVNALLTEEVDFVPNVPGASVARFEEGEGFTLILAEYDSLFQVFFNLEKEQFQDVKVRHALMMAIDRQAVIDIVRQGYGVVHNSHFDHVVPFYEQDKLEGYEYDPAAAAAIFDDLGIVDSDDDGWRDVDGEPWTVQILTFNPGFRDYAEYAQVVQAYWEDIGIKVDLELGDLATLVEQIYEERKYDKPYDVHTSGWASIGPEPNSYANFYMTTEAIGPNLSNYQNDEVNQLFEEARTLTDFDKRMAIYEQIEAILWAELPTIPLYREVRPAVISSLFAIEDAMFDSSLGTNFAHPERIYLAE